MGLVQSLGTILLFFLILGGLVLVHEIGHRRDIYKKGRR